MRRNVGSQRMVRRGFHQPRRRQRRSAVGRRPVDAPREVGLGALATEVASFIQPPWLSRIHHVRARRFVKGTPRRRRSVPADSMRRLARAFDRGPLPMRA
ncbi:hypothetical protein HPB48_001170 [Haemaphysalis longicornis]|uniref:Uncharacterized protein n=1 Tax=Haemaphysalis longicornis TaxID=44386 RepID=A0A9J6FI93_HAELO|nr:hypothetical protein HPB48_001170 [Haemaphysalis longicornis]